MLSCSLGWGFHRGVPGAPFFTKQGLNEGLGATTQDQAMEGTAGGGGCPQRPRIFGYTGRESGNAAEGRVVVGASYLLPLPLPATYDAARTVKRGHRAGTAP